MARAHNGTTCQTWGNPSQCSSDEEEKDGQFDHHPFPISPPKWVEALAPCEGFIASAGIGRTVPHDSIGRPTNLEGDDDDEDADIHIRPKLSLVSFLQNFCI